MATITVEDGTVVANATSYVSELDATAYLTERGQTFSGDVSQALIKAMDFLEQQSFIGNVSVSTQSLQWPRSGVYIDNYFIAVADIPQLLIEAQIEAAIVYDDGGDLLSTLERTIKREKVGALETEFSDNARDDTYYAKVFNKLTKITMNKGNEVHRS